MSTVAAAADTKEAWPSVPSAYKLKGEVGKGGSAVVYHAECVINTDVQECAVKIFNLEEGNVSMDVLRKEIQNLGMAKHPNVVPYHVSFVKEAELWIVMEYLEGGSALDIMKYKFGKGLEEPVLVTILREALKAIAYFHATGFIHRDIKAGNILISGKGDVKLADLGVAAWLVEEGDFKARNTFVGTPCWMAPEVWERRESGYTFSADIWSFGITALELAQGKVPFAQCSPVKVMMMVLKHDPPTLAEEDIKSGRFSKSLKDMIAKCLVKNPNDRISAAKLQQHKVFQKANKPEFLVRTLLADLPSLEDRFALMKKSEQEAIARAKEGGSVDSEAHKASAANAGGVAPVSGGWDFGSDEEGDEGGAGGAKGDKPVRKLKTKKRNRDKGGSAAGGGSGDDKVDEADAAAPALESSSRKTSVTKGRFHVETKESGIDVSSKRGKSRDDDGTSSRRNTTAGATAAATAAAADAGAEQGDRSGGVDSGSRTRTLSDAAKSRTVALGQGVSKSRDAEGTTVAKKGRFTMTVNKSEHVSHTKRAQAAAVDGCEGCATMLEIVKEQHEKVKQLQAEIKKLKSSSK